MPVTVRNHQAAQQGSKDIEGDLVFGGEIMSCGGYFKTLSIDGPAWVSVFCQIPIRQLSGLLGGRMDSTGTTFCNSICTVMTSF